MWTETIEPVCDSSSKYLRNRSATRIRRGRYSTAAQAARCCPDRYRWSLAADGAKGDIAATTPERAEGWLDAAASALGVALIALAWANCVARLAGVA